MAWLMGTAADLHSQARELRRHAADLRDVAVHLSAVATGTRWQSTAAQSYRARVQRLAQDLRRCADRLEHAAWAVDGHAEGVGRVLNAAEQVAGDGLAVARGGWHAAGRAGRGLLHAVGL